MLEGDFFYLREKSQKKTKPKDLRILISALGLRKKNENINYLPKIINKK